MSSKNFNSFKDFQSDHIQTSSRKLFTSHYACSNSDLNLTPVTGTTNGFIFQIINSLIESWGYAWPVLTVSKHQPIDFDLTTNQFGLFYKLVGNQGGDSIWRRLGSWRNFDLPWRHNLKLRDFWYNINSPNVLSIVSKFWKKFQSLVSLMRKQRHSWSATRFSSHLWHKREIIVTGVPSGERGNC